MSDAVDSNLEKELAALTQWTGRGPQVWKRALARVRRPVSPKWAWMAGGIAAALLFASIFVPSFSAARERTKYGDDSSRDHGRGEVRRGFVAGGRPGPASGQPLSFGYSSSPVVGDVAGAAVERYEAGRFMAGVPLLTTASVGDALRGDQAGRDQDLLQGVGEVAAGGGTTERHVVRRATVELDANDVRAAFAKAAHLVSAARGEFVQESSLTGLEPHLQGQLALRVAADRLSDVLNGLRELGKVRSETSGGEDVTVQVVDVESRLRNEQRVEKELLELLENRTDAPLKEVLEVRAALGNVRQEIERLIGQRDQLSRLVALATVLVIIRPADAPPPPPRGLGLYFSQEFHNAFADATRFIADSLGVLLRIVVGGAVWWVIGVVIALIVRFFVRRARTAA